MKYALVLMILVGAITAHGEESNLDYLIKRCLDKHESVSCTIVGFEAEKMNRLADADIFYKLSCQYGEITSCGHKPQYMVLKKK